MSRCSAFAAILAALAGAAFADTRYPVAPERAKANRAKVEAFAEKACWKGSPLAACAVEATSGIRRTPDLFPEDGDFTGPVRAVLAKGEYEGASFLLYGFEDVEDVSVAVDVPGIEADVTVVKVWYQQGTAWGSFFSDPLRRIATPELLLHDESLVHVDHAKRENYVRCDYQDGQSAYRWISFGAQAVDHSYDGTIRNEWIHDARTLKPFAVRKDEFKQLIVTFHAPKDAKDGVAAGRITVSAGGRKAFDLQCEVRVLPFELPLPATFRDTSRRFFCTGFTVKMDVVKEEGVAKNMVAHNMRNATLPALTTPELAREAYESFKRTGFDTEYLFCALPSCNVTTSYPVQPTDKRYDKFVNTTNAVAKSMAAIRAAFGPNVKAYSYGIDEGDANVVRAERETWKGIHRAGGDTVAATQWHSYILFNLDFASIPRQPRHAKKAGADALHDGNPDVLVGWYSDPHSGPENPDFTRRLYGWQTWRNNYDASLQYCVCRASWNDFWYPPEAFLRGLMFVYPQDGRLIDTLEWEGLREGLDDVRYGTLLKTLALRAAQSESVETKYAGRAALTWVAQVDCEHSSLDFLRCEMIVRILDLQNRLSKEVR